MSRTSLFRRRTRALLALSAAAVLAPSLSACSSRLFQLTPEEGAAPATKPAAKPAAKPANEPVRAPARVPARAPARSAPATPPAARPADAAAPAPVLTEPPAVASDSAGVERLAVLANVWHVVRQHHPAVQQRREEWDAAVVRSVGAVRSASGPAALRAELDSVLGLLGDGATRIVRDARPSADDQTTSAARFLAGTPIDRDARAAIPSAPTPSTVGLTLPDGVRLQLRTAEDDGSRANRVTLPTRRTDPYNAVWYDHPYPTLAARVLGVFRVWEATQSLHAHRDGYDDDIDAALRRAIPRAEAAGTAAAYAEALGALAASLDDAAVRLSGASWNAALGDAAVPVRVRMIEGRAIVTGVPGNGLPALAGVTPPTGLAVGTEVTGADGYPMVAYLAERRRLLPSSNDWTRTRDVLALLPRGVAGDASWRVRDASGPERTLAVTRRTEALPLLLAPQRTLPAVRTLAPDIAYVDAERLAAVSTDSTLASLRSMRTLIVDLRAGDVPQPAAFVRQLATAPEFIAARTVRRPVTVPCAASSSREVQRVCADARESTPVLVTADTAGRARTRLVVLIDERTQGAAERLALALDAGAGAVFIGSASAGAAAIAEPLALPGGLTLWLPREEIRRADGGQVHRVGITPLVESRATVRGVRAGQDDVLDRAVAWVQAQGTPVRRRRD